MKKIILYTSAIGLAIGAAAYLLNKKNQSDVSKIQPIENEFDDLKPNTSYKESAHEPDLVEEMMDAKSSSAYSIHDRHTEASNIMCDVFENIYKDVEPVGDKEKDDSVFVESVITNNELDLLSDEIDDLLK